MKGDKMNVKLMIISLLIAIGTIIGVLLYSPGIADQKDNLLKRYETGIVKKIEKCECQAELLHTSKSRTLRNYADVQVKKAQFFDNEREMLIEAMIKMQLEPKQYKIEHFLDQQFYRSLAK